MPEIEWTRLMTPEEQQLPRPDIVRQADGSLTFRGARVLLADNGSSYVCAEDDNHKVSDAWPVKSLPPFAGVSA